MKYSNLPQVQFDSINSFYLTLIFLSKENLLAQAIKDYDTPNKEFCKTANSTFIALCLLVKDDRIWSPRWSRHAQKLQIIAISLNIDFKSTYINADYSHELPFYREEILKPFTKERFINFFMQIPTKNRTLDLLEKYNHIFKSSIAWMEK